MKSVRLRKQGKFYCAYNEDAYVVIDNDHEIIKKQFSKNCYNKYLQLGMKNVNRMEENMLLIEKVKNLSDDKLTKILNYVKDVINE